MNYIVFKGWWCEDVNLDNRKKLLGSDAIRSKDFHKLWMDSIKQGANASEIIIIDSNSPIKPEVIDNEKIISLADNFGHSTNHKGKYCGVTRAHITGVFYALINDYDYCVYLEQDAIIIGEGFVEKCIKKMTKPYMFGNGIKTGHATQQSFFIIRKDGYLDFINNMLNIKSSCGDISPENKFAIATSYVWKFFPEFIFKIRGAKYLLSLFRGFDYVPFGYGRDRPINFEDQFFYFQHGDDEDLNRIKEILKSE